MRTTVTTSPETPLSDHYQEGSFWVDPTLPGEIYILAHLDADSWAAINLSTGIRWCEPQPTSAKAIACFDGDLVPFYGTITITSERDT